MSRVVSVAEACARVTDGTHYTPSNVGAGVPFLTVRDMTAGGLDFHNSSHIAPEEFEKARSAGCAPLVGDVLFSKDGTVGKVHVVMEDRPFAVLSSVAILTPRSDVDSRYLGHFLRTPHALSAAARMKTGSAIRRIILSDLKKLRLPKPPIEEQRRIADILDRADALRAKRREALALLDDLAQSIFIDMFANDIESVPLGELVSEFRYGTSAKATGQGLPVLRIPNVVHGALDLSDLKFLTLPKPELARLLLQTGDILFVRSNGNANNVGRCAVFEQVEADDFVFASYLIRARPDRQRINPVFLSVYLRSREGRTQLLAQARTSAGQYNINIEGLKSVRVPRVPLAEQDAFAACADAVSRQAATTEQCAYELDLFFESLQHRAFTGQL